MSSRLLGKENAPLLRLFIQFVAIVVFDVSSSSVVSAETGKPADTQAAKRGAVLYKKHCASCHGDNGVGGAVVPPMLKRPDYFRAPALNDSEHAWHHSDENLVKTILEGSPRTAQMPAWKNVISKSEARDLVHYVKSLWGARALECQGPKHMSCMQ